MALEVRSYAGGGIREDIEVYLPVAVSINGVSKKAGGDELGYAERPSPRPSQLVDVQALPVRQLEQGFELTVCPQRFFTGTAADIGLGCAGIAGLESSKSQFNVIRILRYGQRGVDVKDPVAAHVATETALHKEDGHENFGGDSEASCHAL